MIQDESFSAPPTNELITGDDVIFTQNVSNTSLVSNEFNVVTNKNSNTKRKRPIDKEDHTTKKSNLSLNQDCVNSSQMENEEVNTSSPGSSANTVRHHSPQISRQAGLTVFLSASTGDLTRLNPYVVIKDLKVFDKDIVASQIEKVGKQLKVLCKSSSQVDNLVQVTKIGQLDIHATLYEGPRPNKDTLNRFIIHGVPWDYEDDDIIQQTGAEQIKRLAKRNESADNHGISSVVLAYKVSDPPTRVNVFWMSFKLYEFIPRPIRCFNCQMFGHTKNVCTKTAKCPRCSGNHDFHMCDNEERICVNCKGSHSAGYRECPAYKQAAIITTIKTKQKVSYAEALKISKQILLPSQTSTDTRQEMINNVNKANPFALPSWGVNSVRFRGTHNHLLDNAVENDTVDDRPDGPPSGNMTSTPVRTNRVLDAAANNAGVMHDAPKGATRDMSNTGGSLDFIRVMGHYERVDLLNKILHLLISNMNPSSLEKVLVHVFTNSAMLPMAAVSTLGDHA
jgi:hypothetical protein